MDIVTYSTESASVGYVDNYSFPTPRYSDLVTSATATLTLKTDTSITTQPSNQFVCTNSPASFTVLADGTKLHYQCKHGSTNVGTDTDTYSIASDSAGDVGNYKVKSTYDG